MLPAFKSGDLVVIDKWAYRSSEPLRGDVVVARFQNEFIIKRIVGLPGEEVELKLGVLLINEHNVREPYPTVAGNLSVERGKLLSGKFATLGDNRDIPACLAVHPILAPGQVIGRVFFHIGLPSGRA